MNIFMVIVLACTRPEKAQDRQSFSTEQQVKDEFPPLAEELLVIFNHGEIETSFSLRVWLPVRLAHFNDCLQTQE